MYIYSLEEGPQFGGQEGAEPLCDWGTCTQAKLHYEGAGSFQMFDRDFCKQIANCEQRCVGKSASGISALVVVSRFLSCIFWKPILCFRGARHCAPVFNAGSLLGTFQARFFVFLVSGPDFKGFGAPAVLLFRTANRQVHTFVPIGATRPPTRQQMGSPSRFPPPSGVGFRTTFWYFFVFPGIMRFYEN